MTTTVSRSRIRGVLDGRTYEGDPQTRGPVVSLLGAGTVCGTLCLFPFEEGKGNVYEYV